jgi:hypothetical protein
VCVCVCVCVYIYIYIYIYAVLKRLATPSDFYSPLLLLFQSPILRSLSLMAVMVFS